MINDVSLITCFYVSGEFYFDLMPLDKNVSTHRFYMYNLLKSILLIFSMTF